ncbi:hypothetical protein ACNPQK_10805 [Acinetobacter guillouiae]|uniref:Uncharacterized protein n=1 Tax=Acinetobacter guillouiae TaxID=106649 RepID=A0A6A1RJJ4_ACIGI|nr:MULTISPECIES: hypothetical protein [Acinetobacter]ENU57075.1 hypothetical protein F981_04210 [Acinetobacter guillouiae CIP 63.46]EPH33453.1 hypothetical protein L291_2879 [Acinetobacter guillouiae MSP4-18]KAB0623733.1 hypothetical protein F7P82_20060 [Acinetobacter guillouiae]MCF0265657.1 hypothetical protein [Acinetobacter guillouiae]QLD63492.1 hypothetical protein CQZ96_020435 [Acinetobacter sp. MYb10]
MNNKLIKTISLASLLYSHVIFAEIPKELLYQVPQNIDSAQLATIEGFQNTSTPFKFVNARIYINQINGKATLNQSKDWNKTYSILPTQTTVRFTSDAQQLFSSGELNFTAQTGQKYQIKTNQADKNSHKQGIQFWIEDLTTGEVITEKQFAHTVANQPQQIYMPVIINK